MRRLGIRIRGMVTPQSCFDNLVSRSPDDRNHQIRIKSIFNTSHPLTQSFCQPKHLHGDECMSIDELLVKYRPTQTSILQCIACLDQVSYSPIQSDRDCLVVRESVLIAGERARAPSVSMTTESPLLQSRSDRQKGLPNRPNRKSMDESSGHDERNASRRRKRRQHMSTEEKEDRRREQNREAQRRYRERNMLASTSDPAL